MYRGINVKFLDVKGSYVSLKYNASNSTTRVKKNQFMEDLEKGVYNVLNQDAMPEELKSAKA